MAQQLSEIMIKAHSRSMIQQLDSRYTSGVFSAGDGYSYDVMNDPTIQSYTNIFQYLQGRVPGLEVLGSSTVPVLRFRNRGVAVYFNEISEPVDVVATISPRDIIMRMLFFVICRITGRRFTGSLIL